MHHIPYILMLILIYLWILDSEKKSFNHNKNLSIMTTEFTPLGGNAKILRQTDTNVLVQWPLSTKFIEDSFPVQEWFPKKSVKINEHGVVMVDEELFRIADDFHRPKYLK